MIRFYKKWHDIKWRDLLFLGTALLICGCIVLLLISATRKVDHTVSATLGEYRPVIILDAGHGGEDGGAVSKAGVQEKDINLAIAMDLKEMLTASGFEVVMIREDDRSIHNETADTIRERKISDLHNRLKIINSYDDCIFLSIHQNQFSDSKYSGAQMFYSTNHSQSKELAESLKNSVVGMIQPKNTREIKPANSSIYLLWNSKKPAVLVECGFLSNAHEAGLLAQEEYQHKMAFSIYSGLLNHWRNVENGQIAP